MNCDPRRHLWTSLPCSAKKLMITILLLVLGSSIETAADLADNVVIWDATVQHERVLYFHDTRNRWEEKAVATDASRTPLRYPYGLYVVRRSTGPLRISLSGEIASQPVLLPVRNGANVFSLSVNLSATLDQLIPGFGPNTIVKGPNASRADLLTLDDPNGNRLGPFYFSTAAGSEGWQEIGVNGSDAPT